MSNLDRNGILLGEGAEVAIDPIDDALEGLDVPSNWTDGRSPGLGFISSTYTNAETRAAGITLWLVTQYDSRPSAEGWSGVQRVYAGWELARLATGSTVNSQLA